MGPFLSPAHSSNSGVFVGSTKGLRGSCKARLVLLGLGETACNPSNGLVPVWAGWENSAAGCCNVAP